MLDVLESQATFKQEGNEKIWPVPGSTWRRRWAECRRLARLEDMVFHDLRRTNATHSAASGVSLRVLAGRIGHTDLTMLERHYAVLVDSAEHAAAENIQEIFSSMMPSDASEPDDQ